MSVWAVGNLFAIYLTHLKTSKIPDGGCFTVPEGARVASRVASLPLIFFESARLEKIMNVLEGELPKVADAVTATFDGVNAAVLLIVSLGALLSSPPLSFLSYNPRCDACAALS